MARPSVTLLSCMLSLVLSLALFCQTACAIGLGDLPVNDANRTLTRFLIPRTYPLTGDELKKMSKVEQDALRRDDYSVLAFKTAGLEDTKIRRAVIMLHGQGRDGWLYQDQANEALYNATRTTGSKDQADLRKLKRSETMIISPEFINESDEELATRTNELQFDEVTDLSTYDSAPAETTLVWQGDSWAEGADSIAPTVIDAGEGRTPYTAPPMSTFEVLDAIIAQLTNTTTYPRLDTIIVAGHSLGAQFVQRYALIGAVPSRSIPVHFFIANPGSFAYLTSQRPYSTADCMDSYDAWKYGLGVFGIRYLYDMVIDSLDDRTDVTDVRVRYLRDRQVHYLFGLDDRGGQGDRRCQAMARECARTAH